MPAPALRLPAQSREPRVIDKMKLGFLSGALIGGTMGFIIGGLQIIRAGPGPKGSLRTIGQYCFNTGASLGFFFSIASIIRSEDMQTWRRQDYRVRSVADSHVGFSNQHLAAHRK